MPSTLKKIKCHERPITNVLYNSDGDLIFTSSKDSTSSVIRSDGSPLGIYSGHDGSIFSISLSPDSLHLFSGSADQTVIDWDVETGTPISRLDMGSVVKGLDSFNENLLIGVSDDSMGLQRSLFLYDNRIKKVNILTNPSFNSTGVFGDFTSNFLILSDSQGQVHKFDLRNLNFIKKMEIHSEKISSISPSLCRTFFITSSSDSQAKIVDLEDFTIKKIFVSEEPVNNSKIFPMNDKVICVGGVPARDVTTTKGKSTIDTSFFDIITCERVGYFSTHYGTINSVDVHPLGKEYCSAGEEGILHIVGLGEEGEFYKAPFTKIE
jgi:translation initiation factor 3 subunit I